MSETERRANEIIKLIGGDMPDPAAHKRWLMTLGAQKLKERLVMLQEQSEVPGAAREIRLSSGNARAVHREVCLSNA